MTSVVAVRRVSRTLQRFPIQAHRARQTAFLLGGQQAGGTQATQGTPLVVPCGDPCTATISASGDSLFGAFLLGNSLVGGSTGSQPPVLKNPTNIPPQGSQSDPSGVSPDGGTVTVCGDCLQDVALKTYPVMNSGWDLVGLDFVQGILASGAQFTNHIRPRHASNAPYPQKPLNGRFAAPILSLSTTPDQFDVELALLFNGYTPVYWGPTAAGIALEFALPGPIGLDFSNQPTNSWTVVLAEAGSGVFQVWTTYPGHPIPND